MKTETKKEKEKGLPVTVAMGFECTGRIGPAHRGLSSSSRLPSRAVDGARRHVAVAARVAHPPSSWGG